MQLFVYISNSADTMSPILAKLMEENIQGATTVECQGMLSALEASSIEPPPIFGSLRQFLNPDHEMGKMLMIVLNDEDVPVVKSVIHEVCGSLKRPNTGILFTMPVMTWEGVSHK